MSQHIVIGLTGGIASGKSLICQALDQAGVDVIDADKVGHNIYEPGTACFDKVASAFSHIPDIVSEDGTINRRALGGAVFGDKKDMKKLTDIVWPAIGEKLKVLITESKKTIVCIEAAVLVEAGWSKSLVDYVWTVEASHEIAKERLMKRNNLSEEEAMKRINSQMTNEERRAVANEVISNEGEIEEVKERVIALVNGLQSISHKL